MTPVVRLEDAALRLAGRVLWERLDLTLDAGELLAVLGPNGAGKTTLLKVMLGLQPLSGGSVRVAGRPPRHGRALVGYVPQQRGFDPDLPIRGRDLVQLGADGHRWGLRRPGRDPRVEAAIDAVGATAFADTPIGLLSGGEQQRLRVAQALVTRPQLLLCDEPLLSLDLAHQRSVCALLDEHRRQTGSAIVFVTHDINPVLPYVDRVLYLVAGRSAIGAPRDVLTSARLSALYGTAVDVVDVRGRVLVVGGEETAAEHAHHLEPHQGGRR